METYLKDGVLITSEHILTCFEGVSINIDRSFFKIAITWKYCKKPIVLVRRNNACYECVSHSVSTNGYPKISFKNKTTRLSRFIYCLLNDKSFSDITDSMVLHTCDNPLCGNPDHLKLGTHTDNMCDRQMKNRQAYGVRNAGAKITRKAAHFIKHSNMSVKVLAARFNLSKVTIRQIKRGELWKHV